MKINTLFLKLWLLCFLAIFSTSAHAQRVMSNGVKSGSIFISSPNNELVKIELDGPQYFEESYVNNMLISNLLPGEYSLKVYASQQRGRSTLIINQIVRISPEQRTVFTVQPNGKVAVRTVFDKNSIVLNSGGYDRPQPYPRSYDQEPISRLDFNNLVVKVKKTPFKEDKLEILNIASGYNLFYINQIHEMMKLFPFDDEKLSCAKILAPRAYDPQNLYDLADDFAFSSTREKFYEYINQNRKGERHPGSVRP